MEETHLEQTEVAQEAPESAAQSESFEVIDYVRELYLNSEEQRRIERKKLNLLRAITAMFAVIVFLVVASAAVFVPILARTVTKANEVLAAVEQIDIDKVVNDIDKLSEDASDMFVSVGEAVTVLNDLDMETLNETIAELKTGVESFSELDIDSLNQAIADLNAIVEPLAKLFGKK